MTRSRAGKMKKAKGNKSLMAVFAAASSAFCLLMVLKESENTRRDWARLVPNFSV
jgi:hypothetical protein